MEEHRPRILVIDDEESIRYTFEGFLSDQGYVVSTAENYDEAVTHLEETDFNLIFADIFLIGKSGLDFLLEVRSRNLSCPVIMVTGYPSAETAQISFQLGAFGHISKPVPQEKLLHLARTALGLK